MEEFDGDLKTKQKETTKKPKQYVVKFLNDDYTNMDDVVMILQKVFKKSNDEATAITMQIHKEGKGIAGGPYTLEIAETKLIQTEHIARQLEAPLKATVEEA